MMSSMTTPVYDPKDDPALDAWIQAVAEQAANLLCKAAEGTVPDNLSAEEKVAYLMKQAPVALRIVIGDLVAPLPPPDQPCKP